MTAVRMLFGGHGGYARPTSEAAFAMTAASEGGWGQNHANPAYYNGKTYFAYVDGTAGDICVRSYNHATGVTSAATVMHAALSDDMVHGEPSLVIDPTTHKIIVCYSASGASQVYKWTSTSAEDISAGSEVGMDATWGGTNYTYVHLMFLGTVLYAWLQVSGSGSVGQIWAYTSSADSGATWSTLTAFFTEASTIGYIEASKTSESRVDFTAVAVPVGGAPPTSLYHAYFDGTFHKSDGTSLSTPFATANMTLVWNAAPDNALSSVVKVKLRAGLPIAAIVGTYGGANHVRMAAWSGVAWTSAEIEDAMSNGLLIVSDDEVLLCKLVSSVTQVFRYRTDDGWASWTEEQLTSGTDHSFRAIPVIDADAALKYLWLEGSSVATVGNTTCRTMGYGV